VHIEFTGRHIEVTEPIRQFALDRLERLRSLPEVIEVHFILTSENHQRHVAEVNLKTRDGFLNCADETHDMYTSIASALDKLEKQVLKSKSRHIKRRRKAVSARIIEARSMAEFEDDSISGFSEIVRSDASALRPLSVEEAAGELGSSDNAFLLFRESRSERVSIVYKRKDGDIGWMYADR
jgi:putative sigma-54 modulation protein